VLVAAPLSASPWQYTLSNAKITVGPRVLKAYVVDATVITDATSFRLKAASSVNYSASAGPIFFTTTLNLAVTSGSQTAPNLVLPHYSP
jgi:hypothetical protein